MANRYRLPRAYKWFLVGGLLLAVIAGLTVRVIDHEPSPRKAIVLDARTMQKLAIIVLDHGASHTAPDGRIAICSLLANGIHAPDTRTSLCYSERAKSGPSESDVARGNYAAFPWARAKGQIFSWHRIRPLFWEPNPMPDGLRLVAFSDGSVKILDELEFQALAIR